MGALGTLSGDVISQCYKPSSVVQVLAASLYLEFWSVCVEFVAPNISPLVWKHHG